MTSKKLQIGVIGPAGPEEYPKDKAPVQYIYDTAEEIGKKLAENNCIVVTGGKTGIMESASRGAKNAGGITVGMVTRDERFSSNDYTDVEITLGSEVIGMQEYLLPIMCDALIVLGGGSGTLIEIAAAYSNNRPIIALEKTGSWADLFGNKYIDDREKVKIELAKNADEAVSKTLELVRKKYKIKK